MRFRSIVLESVALALSLNLALLSFGQAGGQNPGQGQGRPRPRPGRTGSRAATGSPSGASLAGRANQYGASSGRASRPLGCGSHEHPIGKTGHGLRTSDSSPPIRGNPPTRSLRQSPSSVRYRFNLGQGRCLITACKSGTSPTCGVNRPRRAASRDGVRHAIRRDRELKRLYIFETGGAHSFEPSTWTAALTPQTCRPAIAGTRSGTGKATR